MKKTRPLSTSERIALSVGEQAYMLEAFGSLAAAAEAFARHRVEIRTVEGTRPSGWWMFVDVVPAELRSLADFMHERSKAIADRLAALNSEGRAVRRDALASVMLAQQRRAWLTEHFPDPELDPGA